MKTNTSSVLNFRHGLGLCATAASLSLLAAQTTTADTARLIGSQAITVNNPARPIIGVSVSNDASSSTPTADFDHNGSVGVDDVFAYLTAWFARDPRCDMNHDGNVTPTDLFAFLGMWFNAYSSRTH